MKRCSRCGQEKPLAEFYRASKARDGLNPACKPCVNAYNAAWDTAHPERAAANKRTAALRQWARRYLGLEANQYIALVDRASGRCEVCGRAESTVSKGGRRYTLALDHDHATGRVRGMLCRQCNTALGCAQDSPDMLRKLAAYLENPPGPVDLPPVPHRRRSGYHHSAETRAKIGAAHRGRPSPHKGEPRPPEVVEKIRQSQLGQKRSPEARANMRAARLKALGRTV